MPRNPGPGRTPLAWQPERKWFNLGAWIIIADLVFAFLGYEYRLLPVAVYNTVVVLLLIVGAGCLAISGGADIRALERRRTQARVGRFAYYGAFAGSLFNAMGTLQRIALLVVAPLT